MNIIKEINTMKNPMDEFTLDGLFNLMTIIFVLGLIIMILFPIFSCLLLAVAFIVNL